MLIRHENYYHKVRSGMNIPVRHNLEAYVAHDPLPMLLLLLLHIFGQLVLIKLGDESLG